MALAVVGIVIASSAVGNTVAERDSRVNVLTTSTNDCVECHTNRQHQASWNQYGVQHDGVGGRLCRIATLSTKPILVQRREGTFILHEPTQPCVNVVMPTGRRSSTPVVMPCPPTLPTQARIVTVDQRQMLSEHPRSGFRPEGVLMRNALHAIEGPEVTNLPAGNLSQRRPPRRGRFHRPVQ
ncbi:MAG: hypothetical protein R2873_34620 [Caldilineaceae bacterium]